MKNSACGACSCLHDCIAISDKECWATIRADERKKIFDELYVKLINESDEDVRIWCEENLIDDVEEYIELLREQKDE